MVEENAHLSDNVKSVRINIKNDVLLVLRYNLYFVDYTMLYAIFLSQKVFLDNILIPYITT